jgi:hypothetical protein
MIPRFRAHRNEQVIHYARLASRLKPDNLEHQTMRGNSLFHDVAELQSGRLISDDLPIHIFQYVDLDFSVEHPHRWRQRHRRVTSIL